MSEDIKKEQWTTVISTKDKRFYLGLKELIDYKDLIFLFFKRDFTAVYKQTILGPAWYIIQPLITSIIYSFVFGNLAGLGTDKIPSYLFYMAGIVIWRLFSDTLRKTSDTFLANSSIFGKVYFPRMTVPISSILSNFVAFAIQLMLFLVFFMYYVIQGMQVNLHWSLLLAPLLIVQVALLGTGLGLMVTSMTTKYRDLKFLITFGLQLWMYGTPIAYPLSEIMTKVDSLLIQWLFIINPIAFPVELFRFMIFQSNHIDWIQGGISIGLTLFFFLWGVINFNRSQRDFMDRI